MVPHLTTALTGPINELEQRILESMPAIERWFRLEWMEHTPPFYSAVDLRNAGFKLAPVGTHLFPGGFNNLTQDMLPLSVQAAMAAIEKICPEAKNLLLIPGKQTHSSFYLSNLATLKRIFTQAGLNVRLGSLDPAVTEPTELNLADGSSLTVEPLLRQRGRLGLKDFDPCTILLNNELSDGVPRVLEHLHEQYLLPPLHAGGTLRRKSQHFKSYEEVAKKFSKLLGMDPWLIHPMSVPVSGEDLSAGHGLEALQTQVDLVLSKTRKKYKDYGIQEKPFVLIKPDAGGHSQGTLMLRDAKELADLGRRGAESLNWFQSGQGPHQLLVQEGVVTHERVNEAVAEPVVYMMDRYVVGGFYRIHAERGSEENLNAPGSSFVPLAFAQSSQLPRPGEKPGASAPNRFYMYGVIARLAMLAASYELEVTDPEAEVYA
ncbi:glutamate--cysteine ligase [Paucibacter sp. DJ2R-2]|uniref:glutamate--cysteine ligase n=1 Tax=Paucibacter sp. DJ2R-2 TaxID=2893558 RepID=UPI0021E43135|nr:glutamate--cysteine ligase [Paucibacter sp. DJ2R-2]MCV2421078.1 glutamate--cysteine ligase [Paucibacter sp. DJ4R-1]MCV2439056.1 glutamate--cysteine ligase [Paucibacter sp. DJ2R-2]